MRAAWLIAKRELGAYFRTPLGYIVAAVLLFLFGALFQTLAMGTLAGEAKLSSEVVKDFFYYTSGLVFFAAILMSFRLFAEERQMGTMVLLETAPIKEWQVVAGKFLSAYLVVCMVTALSVYMPIMVQVSGKVTWGHILAGYLGLFMFAAPLVAMGTFASALTRSQVVAALVGAGIMLLFIGFYVLIPVVQSPIKDVISYLDLYFEHFGPTFTRGMVRTTDFIYYGSLTFVFLLATTKVLAARRWAG